MTVNNYTFHVAVQSHCINFLYLQWNTKLNKTGSVCTTYHWGVFVQTLLTWKSNKFYISEWMSVVFSIQHAMRKHHVVICGLSGSLQFKKKLLPETFLIPRNEQDHITKVHRSSGAKGVVCGPEGAQLADNRVPTKLRKCHLFLPSPIHACPCHGPWETS